MLILHLSTTPLVGAPGAICAALNAIDGIEARWVVLDATVGVYGTMDFALDLVWTRDREQALRLLAQADVVHLHNFIDLDSSAFAPIDFRQLWAARRPMVRQFHSTPEWVARQMQSTVESVIACPIPKLVIAQYPERYLRCARTVPNIVEMPPAPADAVQAPGRALRIGYAPSRFNSARSSRWDTKGYPETVRMLRRVERDCARQGIAVEVDLIEQVSHAQCMARKARCDIVIDDLVTGSYHRNTLESLAQGAVCLSYLDERTLMSLTALTGRTDFPVLNVGLEDAGEVLVALCGQPDLVAELGRQGRAWMQAHWSQRSMAEHFLSAYRAVQAAPHQPFAARWAEGAAASWAAVELNDIRWRNRRSRWPRITPDWVLALRAAVGRGLRACGLAVGRGGPA